jgi:hypothetical protein
MNIKAKDNEIPEKILSQNIFLLQDLNKEIENELKAKEAKTSSQKLLIQSIFNVLNSQITLIFQLSKANNSSFQKSNNSNLIEHIISFNKEIMMKQIQKIVSLVSVNNNDFRKNLTIKNGEISNKFHNKINKQLNKSFLTNTSYKINNKNRLDVKGNKTVLIDDDLSQDDYTTQNENNDNNKSYLLNSSMDKRLCKKISSKKYTRKNENKNSNNLNTNLVKYIRNKNKYINKNNTQDKNINNLKKRISLSKIDKNENESSDDINEEENPVRKVKNIIINAKRNASMNKDRNRTKENFDVNNIDNNKSYTKINNGKTDPSKHNSVINNEKNKKIHKLNSSGINYRRYKNIYDDSSDSINNLKIKNTNKTNGQDKSINFYGNISTRIVQKDRESRQLLYDGMKNIKNRLIYNKLHKKE